MTLNELKAQAQALNISVDDARKFGHIGHKATWQAAIDTFLEWGVMDAAQEAQQPAETVAEAITNVVYSQQSRDAFYWVAYAVVLAVFATFLIAAKLTQLAWQASAPLRARASGRIHSEVWAFVGPWPELITGL